MKDFLTKYWKVIAYSLLGIIAAIILYKGGIFIYKNSYSHENYSYYNKSFQNQIFDQNVDIIKNIKNNGTKGNIKMTFDKKDLAEEYIVALDKNNNKSNIEFSVIGKLNSGDINIRMVDGKNYDVFNKTVKGQNIKEVSTTVYNSDVYKFIITPNASIGGDLDISFVIDK